jgi:hypothetical protein
VKLAIFSIAALGAGVLCTLAWTARVPEQLANRGLVVLDRDLDFGEVWEQNRFRWTIPIQNTTSHAIEIDDIRTSCNCTSVEPNSLVVPGNGTVELHLTIDLATADELATKPSASPFSISVLPRVRGFETSGDVWIVKGTVRKLFSSITPSVFDYGEQSVFEDWPTKTSVVRCERFVNKVVVACDPQLATVSVRPLQNDPHTFEVSVTPSRRERSGDVDFPVLLQAIGMDGTQFSGRSIRLFGRVVADVLSEPSEVRFTPAAVGTVLEDSVFFSSRKQRSFRVVSATSDDDNTTISTQEEQSAGNCVFRIKHRISKVGESWSSVRFAVTSDDAPAQQLVNVNVFAYGLKPARAEPKNRNP